MNSNSEEKNALKGHRASKKRERTRAELLAAARKVFAARGYHDASILDITNEADVGVGTFYLHFRDKDEAFNTLLEEVLNSLREQVIAEMRHRGESSLPVIVRAIFRHAYEQRELFRIALTGGKQVARTFHIQDMITAGVTRALAGAEEQGLLVDYDPALLARLISGLIIQGIIWWFEQDEPAPELMADQVLTLLSRGLPAQLFATGAAPDAAEQER